MPRKDAIPRWLRVSFWIGTVGVAVLVTMIAIALEIDIVFENRWHWPIWGRVALAGATLIAWALAIESLWNDLREEWRTAKDECTKSV